VRLARNAYDRAQLHLRFAERRLEEIAELIKSGRFEDVKIASTEFEYYVQQALQSLQVVMAGDPVRASQLTGQISASMLAYVETLKGVWVSVPDSVRPSSVASHSHYRKVMTCPMTTARMNWNSPVRWKPWVQIAGK
jgi:hypothetical protein